VPDIYLIPEIDCLGHLKAEQDGAAGGNPRGSKPSSFLLRLSGEEFELRHANHTQLPQKDWLDGTTEIAFERAHEHDPIFLLGVEIS
jgi:hypothetical protein